MFKAFLAKFGDKKAIRHDAAKRVKKAFDGVNWRSDSFSINGGPLLRGYSGETRFYPAHEIDAAINRLNEVLRELSA